MAKAPRTIFLESEIIARDIRESIGSPPDALKAAGPEEKRELVREQIKEIRIPEEGDAVLVSEQDGLSRLLAV